jgi:hypothetical protein
MKMLSKFRDDPTVQSPGIAISLRLGHQKRDFSLAENKREKGRVGGNLRRRK